MATVNYTATTSWQEVTQAGSAATDDYLFQNKSGAVTVFATYADSLPSEGAPDFIVEPRGTLIRAGVDGKLYIRTSGGTARCVVKGKSA